MGNIRTSGGWERKRQTAMIATCGAMNQVKTYNFSFIGGGLLLPESLIVADEYHKAHDWTAAAETVQKQNLLQARTPNTGKRILRETCSRLRVLTAAQLDLLRSGPRTDQQQLLWLAACKRYELLYDFGSEVIRSRFLELQLALSPNDFEGFLEAKSLWHPEIEELAASTRSKMRQVTFRMLREAEILSEHHVIQPFILSTDIVRVIQADAVSHFSIFPVSEADIRATLT